MERTGRVTPECYVQAIGNSIFELSSVLWTTAIAATLYMFVLKRMPADQVEKKLGLMFLVCLGIPILLACLPLFDDGYGPSGAWCWVRAGTSKTYWQFIIFYGPLWIAIGFNAFVYVRTWRLLRRTLDAAGGGAGDETYKKLHAVMQRLQMYPFILLIVWLFASINRLYEALSGGDQVFALYFLQKVFSSSQGLLNSLVYGFSGGVREAIAERLAKCCPRLFKDPSLSAAGLTGAARSMAVTAGGGGDAAGADVIGSGKAAAMGMGITTGMATAVGGAGSINGERVHLQLEGDGDGFDDGDIHVTVPPPAASVSLGMGLQPRVAQQQPAFGTSAPGLAATVVRNPINAAAAAAAAATLPPPGAADTGAVADGAALPSRSDRVKGMQQQ